MARYLARTESVAWRVVEGEAVLVHAESSAYYGLNRTGTVLWEALVSQPRTSEELLGAIAPRVEGLPPEGRGDVENFLKDLLGAGLVEEAAPNADSASATPIGTPVEPLSGPPQLLPFGELEQLILSGE